MGILHAGWRGVAANILAAGVAQVSEHFGIAPRDIRVHFGPAIQACHFEVQDDVAKVFSRHLEHRDGARFVNLHAALRDRALTLNIPHEHITRDARCTVCARDAQGNFLFSSWRRDSIREQNLISFAILR